MGKILIVDDEPAIRAAIRDVLEFSGYDVCEANSGQQAIEMVQNDSVDLVLLDVKMPEMDGVETLRRLKEFFDSPVVMVSAHADHNKVAECIGKGAYDFIQKPVDMNRLLVCARNAMERVLLMQEASALKSKFDSRYEIIGESESMRNVSEMIDKVANSDARVLILGESGVGKELVAHWIHQKSDRAKTPYLQINCTAVPQDEMELLLFGQERSAVGGKSVRGDFERANGGTLFFDEIADLSVPAQARLLRTLQESRITRLDGEREIPVNVRVLAASSKKLEAEVAAGRFSAELYHRLNAIVITVPSLGERIEDIPLLVKHFLKEICATTSRHIPVVSREAMEQLRSHSWPGNVRELRNLVERLLIFCGDEISAEDVRRHIAQDYSFSSKA